jgi:hypothetical protein
MGYDLQGFERFPIMQFARVSAREELQFALAMPHLSCLAQ